MTGVVEVMGDQKESARASGAPVAEPRMESMSVRRRRSIMGRSRVSLKTPSQR